MAQKPLAASFPMLMSEVTVWLSAQILSSLRTEADRQFPLETGGALIGYWSDADTVVVTEFVGPGPDSVHRRYSYQHDHEWEASQIALHYHRSGRSHVYIGDWHTHPEARSGDLSGTDRRSIRRVIKSREARARRPLMVVLFGKPEHWTPSVWVSTLKPRWAWRQQLLIEETKLQLFSV
ncbi:Mov34/MPN/PAD-1 family protein [Bradyrhizobium mercantei]|uniref:Mov34/MPN/PAD-1 family protein n=1 Tax=Bradyrhizobium mercantei TaxID=1904807 RepID=UPI0009FB87EC